MNPARSAEVYATQWKAIAIGAFFLVALSSSIHAQTNVAIIDLGVVFENHSGFQSQLERLRQEATSLQQAVAQERQNLQFKMEQLSAMYAPESAEFKQAEKDLMVQDANITVEARSKVRQLTTEEARIHYQTYQEVSRYVEDYCSKNNIRLVMRYAGGQMSLDDPESIMHQINGAVVFHRQDRDITQVIVQSMKSAKTGVGGN